jgi:hypothetical protein
MRTSFFITCFITSVTSCICLSIVLLLFFFEMAVVFKGIERSCLLDVYVSLFSPLYKRLLCIFSYLLLNNCLAHAKISSLAKSMELLELLKCLLPGHIGPQGK